MAAGALVITAIAGPAAATDAVRPIASPAKAGDQQAHVQPCACTYFGAAVATTGTEAFVGEPDGDGGAGLVDVYTETSGSWKLTGTLTAADGQGGDDFGNSLAVTTAGLVVGAPGHDDQAGAVYVFTGSGSSWSQSAELADPGAGAGSWFGDAVAASAATVVVGAPEAAGGVGAAYVFSDGGGQWSEQAALAGPSAAGSAFGYSVAVSGPEALVGAPGGTGQGSAYLFSDGSGAWGAQQTFEAPKPVEGDDFGNAVALEGETAVVTAWSATTGAAYVLNGSSGTWVTTQTLEEKGAKGKEDLGAGVALSGSTLVIGAAASNGDYGSADVFSLAGGSWSLTQDLAPAGSDSGEFFSNKAVAVSGSSIVVGAAGHGGQPHSVTAGAAYLFASSGGSWSQSAVVQDLTATPDPGFGTSVAIGSDGSVVGSPDDNGGAGRAYLVTPNLDDLYTPTLTLVATSVHSGDHFGAAVGVSGQTAAVAAPGRNGGVVYLFAETGAVPFTRGTIRCRAGSGPVSGANGQCRAWLQTGILSGADTVGGDDFGASVSFSGQTMVVGAPGHGGAGAAYVFSSSSGSWQQVAELSEGSSGAQFGASVATDGSTLVVGAPGVGGGEAYVFSDSGGTWSGVASLSGTSGSHGAFGSSVATAGGTIAVGAPGAGGGAAYVFGDSSGSWSVDAQLSASDASAGNQFGAAVAASSDVVVVGAPDHPQGGRGYVFSGGGGGWTQTAVLSGTGTKGTTMLGASAGLSGTLALLGEPKDGAGTGDGYVFSV